MSLRPIHPPEYLMILALRHEREQFLAQAIATVRTSFESKEPEDGSR